MRFPSSTFCPSRISLFGLSLLVASTVAACGPGDSGPPSESPPSLVVLMVVDQLRADLVTRYEPHLSGGLHRILEGGARFQNATHDHAGTYTGPGHATLATGAYPSRHGLSGNDWWSWTEDGWRRVYAVSDSTSGIVGMPERSGRSPANLMREGIADWFRQTYPEATITSISRKDRAAIPLAGMGRDGHVYWLDRSSGRFVTSEYYRSEYPEWVEAFNMDSMPALWADSVWEGEVPWEAAQASRPDPHPNEGDSENTTFPHHAQVEIDHPLYDNAGYDSREIRYNRWIADKPVVDDAVLTLARSAVRALDMGRGSDPDFLAVSLSATDLVGHDYGPLSREQLVNLLHLDRALGDFFDFLDRQVGEGGWILALSADHGMPDLVEHTLAQGEDARRIDLEGGVIWKAAVEAEARASSPEEKAALVADALRNLPDIARVWTDEELMAGNPSDSFTVLFRNSRVPGRWPELTRFGVHMLPLPHRVDEPDGRGSMHGSPYHYDRHVPLIFYGAGIPPARRGERVATVDLAPTLARLAGVSVPADLDGRVLEIR